VVVGQEVEEGGELSAMFFGFEGVPVGALFCGGLGHGLVYGVEEGSRKGKEKRTANGR